MKSLFFLLFCCSALGLFAIDNNPIDDARSAALGGASSSLESASNPGASSMHPENLISAHYSNPYGLNELSTVASQLFYSHKMLDFGAAFSSFGYEKYNEMRISAMLSKKLSKNLSFGVRFNYYSIMMSELEDRKTMMSADCGFLLQPTSKLSVGFVAEHLLHSAYSTERGEYDLPVNLRLGANYLLSSELMLVGEVEKNALEDAYLKLGCELLPVEHCAIRIGLVNQPFRPTFGVGYSPGRFVFDVATIYHTVLGFHSRFSMGYKF